MSGFPNYAGCGPVDTIDGFLRAELEAAGVEVISTPLRMGFNSEVNTRIYGALGPWGFRRAHCYWVAEGPGLPLIHAIPLWQKCGSVCRVNGDCTGPHPLQNQGFGVGLYHVDTTEGLKALALTIQHILDFHAPHVRQRELEDNPNLYYGEARP